MNHEPTKFYSKITHKLRDLMKPLFNLGHDNIGFHGNKELETLIQQKETSITKDVSLILFYTNLPFHNTVGSILIGKGCVLQPMSVNSTLLFENSSG